MALALPHWHTEYGKYHVFSTFEIDFFPEIENSPPMAFPILGEDLFFSVSN